MTVYLPDTKVFIAWTGFNEAEIGRRFAAHRGELRLSSIVLFELYFGAFNGARVERNMREIDNYGIPLLEFDREDARIAGKIRTDLRGRGKPIGPYDLLIAGQALARGLTVVTRNTGEFARVEGLKIESWTA